MMEKGWYKDSEYVHLWVHLMLMANHTGREWMYKGKIHRASRGQFVTSRLSLSQQTGIQESKIERILKCFKDEQQIELQNLYTSRLISIINYEEYQSNEHDNEQPVNSERTASEQQMNTTKELKNLRIKENTDISSPDGNGESDVEKNNKAEYIAIAVKDIKSVSEFINAKKPKHYQPYVDLWNLFCDKHRRTRVSQMSDSRKRKLSVRLNDAKFDFVAILRAASKQSFAMQSAWFTFDFLIANDNNYVKVLEMKYVDSGGNNSFVGGGGGNSGIDLTNRVK